MPPQTRWRSIEWKLPLLISALLLAVVAGGTVVAFHTMHEVAQRAAEDRVAGISYRMAGLLGEAVRRLRTEARQIAADSLLLRYATTQDRGARSALERRLRAWQQATPQVTGVEVRTAAGAPMLRTGDPSIPVELAGWNGGAADRAAGDVRLSPMVAAGDSLLYAVSAPIVASTRDTVGYLVQYRRMLSAPTSNTLHSLINADAMFLLGNRDGKLWTDLDRVAQGPPLAEDRQGQLTVAGADHEQHIGAVAAIANTPWVVWIGLPHASIREPVQSMMWRLILITAVILTLGAVCGWIASRRITTPLKQVMRAAEGIATGDYSHRVQIARADEIGRLATSFDSMAAKVEEAQQHLETRVAERTHELSVALERLRETQEELVRKEKLALLGQLAGGVGHELRNPLGVMTNAVHYLGMVLTDAPPTVHEYLGILRTQIGLAERIVGDLLDSARVKTPAREPLAVSQLLAEQLDRAGRPDNVTVMFDVESDLPHAYVDRVQIGQVLLNLITNGVQAMAGRGGTLTLRAHRDGGRHVIVDVADTGPGIAPEHVAKIFEPLFTTKARGIGLGLAVARTLAHANGGDITVASPPGVGATFTLRLPAVAAEGA